MLKEGQKAPSFTLPSVEGRAVTLIVDGQGVVRKVFPKVKVDGHAESVLDALRGLGRPSEA